MYQRNQIGRMRLYQPDPSVFEALRHSEIHVMVGVPNQDILDLALYYDAAQDWVTTNIRPYWSDVKFRQIVVGNNAIPGESAEFVLPAIKNVHNALKDGGLWHKIKVSTSVPSLVMAQYFPPSAGIFTEESRFYMEPIAHYLHSIGAPLIANIYPYFSYVENPQNTWLPYALFLKDSPMFTDSGNEYLNLFDATVDAFYAALEKVGAKELKIVVGETGWPSEGTNEAAKDWIAWIYNSNLVKHVLSSKGTPRRPGKSIETYLFSLFDQDLMLGNEHNSFGLFRPDFRPHYPIDFMQPKGN
ncbi:hypothetical protein MKW98_010258 [Papaver atlanticum]|uniref:Glucan endo-1,3-beta-D-glucosidase n=1 Tax=Papaver atlanticum TaxID=357466 RepID=A0AAD4XGU7_9MAGN|nr:hypothetical protein MKW98_010258 [Papaver atlanticum]